MARHATILMVLVLWAGSAAALPRYSAQYGQLDMQGDVTVAVQMDARFAAYVNLGKGGTQEYAGLAYVLPHDGYLKAGRFTPDYGWGWADHKLPGRAYLLDPAGSQSPAALVDAGLEVGMHTQLWEVTASALQGTAENGESYAARLALRRSYGPVNLVLGSSVLRRELAAGHARAWGGFGAVAAGPLAWLFQVDETGDGHREGILVTQELTWRLVRGIHLRGTYGHQDPDHREASGSRSRWGAGFDSLLSPFFGVQVMASYHHLRPGELVVLLTTAAPGPLASRAAAETWIVGPGSEVVFVSKAPMESFEGTTDQVHGQITCDPRKLLGPCDLRLVVDLASLDTGIGLRNTHMRDRHLETESYPEAVFTANEVIAASAPALLPDLPVELTVRGTFDLHGVAHGRQLMATVTLASDGMLAVAAEFPVKLSDHDIDRPSFLVMKLADEQQVRVDLLCRPEGP